MYNPDHANLASFNAIKSPSEVDAAEATGNVFLQISRGPNSYEIDTGNVLICPARERAASPKRIDATTAASLRAGQSAARRLTLGS